MMTFSFRPARAEDIPSLVALETEIERSLPSRDMFAIDGPEFYEPIAAGAGHILLAFDECDRLAGVSVLRYPLTDEEENLGWDCGLSSGDRSKVRHMESIFVRSDCRRSGLSDTLLKESMRACENDGRDFSFATVWPLNKASLSLFFRHGFTIRGFAYKYGGRPRFILMHTSLPNCDEKIIRLNAEAFEEHSHLLSLGLIGTGLHVGSEGVLEIEYRRLLL